MTDQTTTFYFSL